MEVINICHAVWIYACQKRNLGRQLGKIVPVNDDTGRGCDRDEVQCVIRRPASRKQADDGVDDRFLVHDVSDRHVVITKIANAKYGTHGLCSQVFTQLSARIYERPARQLQTHELHEHLVAVGRAIEGAGAWPVIRRRLSREQFIAADLANRIFLANSRFFFVGQAGDHRSGRHEGNRQMPERQGAY